MVAVTFAVLTAAAMFADGWTIRHGAERALVIGSTLELAVLTIAIYVVGKALQYW